jgi:hypothetical protein
MAAASRAEQLALVALDALGRDDFESYLANEPAYLAACQLAAAASTSEELETLAELAGRVTSEVARLKGVTAARLALAARRRHAAAAYFEPGDPGSGLSRAG